VAKYDTSGATALAAPESVRNEVWNTAGVPNFFGINLTQVFNYGVGRSYNTLFSNWIGSTAFQGYAQGAATAFVAGSEEITTALNLTSPNVLVPSRTGIRRWRTVGSPS